MNLDDRMKLYEGLSPADGPVCPLLPVLARLDGRAFHSFTQGLGRPFDPRLSDLMARTSLHLADTFVSRAAYTQSDEITLLWQQPEFGSELPFGGRVCKLISVLAAEASVFFNRGLSSVIPEKSDRRPVFDCRVWTVPNREEAVNSFLWRQQDAVRNSVQAAARSRYSDKQLFKKSCPEMHEMLHAVGINWSEYPGFFKQGRLHVRRPVVRPFTTDELALLPEKHAARSDPGLMVERHEYVEVPHMLSRLMNAPSVLFDGTDPVEKSS